MLLGRDARTDGHPVDRHVDDVADCRGRCSVLCVSTVSPSASPMRVSFITQILNIRCGLRVAIRAVCRGRSKRGYADLFLPWLELLRMTKRNPR